MKRYPYLEVCWRKSPVSSREIGRMDGLKVDETKISARRSQIGPNVHHTDEKLKDQKETNRQTDRIRQYKKKKCL
jgi:hypothetical protein